MSGRLAECGGTVVARHTRTDHLRVIHRDHGLPNSWAMALCAIVRRGDMRGDLAGGRRMGSVMTADASLCTDRRMAEVSVLPRLGRAVAGIAGLARHNVVRIFTRGDDAVVATDATSGHFVVIHDDVRLEHRGRMTRFATIGGQNMIGALLVTTRATPDDFGVVHANHRRERGNSMARGAIVRGIDVRRIFAHRVRTVVAREAAAEHVGMIHAQRGTPCVRGMACVAPIRGGDVAAGLARRRRSIVATGAGAGSNLSVIHAEHGHPCLSPMTLIALIG